jgi:RNA polymerase sigma factor (sigma-70 family)
MSDVSRMLDESASGFPKAAEQLLPLVYDELRKLAAAKLADEPPGQTLDATALVHEAYLRLVGPAGSAGPELSISPDGGSRPAGGTYWQSRRHFFAAAAEAMRRILIDRARHKRALKAGGKLAHQVLDPEAIAAAQPSEDILAVDEALRKLEASEPEIAQLVKLRYFVGMTIPEAADVLDISPRTADAWWAYAKAWLVAELRPAGG